MIELALGFTITRENYTTNIKRRKMKNCQAVAELEYKENWPVINVDWTGRRRLRQQHGGRRLTVN